MTCITRTILKFTIDKDNFYNYFNAKLKDNDKLPPQ